MALAKGKMELNQLKELFEDIYLYLKRDDEEINYNSDYKQKRLNLLEQCKLVLIQMNSDIIDKKNDNHHNNDSTDSTIINDDDNNNKDQNDHDDHVNSEDDQDDDNNSYLDMCANKNLHTTIKTINSQSLSLNDEYMVFNQIEKLEDNDIYDNCSTIINTPTKTLTNLQLPSQQSLATTTTTTTTATSLFQQHDDCPFSGLPAAHLPIKNASKIGYLNRIEKRLFFDQTKKYYSGIIDKWLLMYSSGATDLKPSSYLYLDLCNVEIINELKHNKKEFMFQLQIDNIKKYYFQANSLIDMNEWLNAIKQSKKLKLSETTLNALNCNLIKTGILSNLRKLPTPPLNYNCNNDNNNSDRNNLIEQHQRISNRSDNIDDIYEEPNNILIDRNISDNLIDITNFNFNNNNSDELINSENQYDNVTEINKLMNTETDTYIIGNKMIKIINGIKIEYDIPKNIPIINKQLQVNNTENVNYFNNENTQDTIEKNLTIDDYDSKNYELIQSNKQTEQIDINKKLIGIVKTNKKLNKKDKRLIKEQQHLNSPSVKDTEINFNENEIIVTPTNRTPVKKWLFNRLNKSISPSNLPSTSSSHQQITNKTTEKFVQVENKIKTLKTITTTPTKLKQQRQQKIKSDDLSDINKSIVNEKTPPKGSKINMIINQLEANGHLPLISKNFNDRRNTMMYELDENYDLVSNTK